MCTRLHSSAESHVRSSEACNIKLLLDLKTTDFRSGVLITAVLPRVQVDMTVVLVLPMAEEPDIPDSAKFWCPVPSCSQLMVLAKQQGPATPEGQCSACHAKLCLSCRGLGHAGMTCAEAQVSRICVQVISKYHVAYPACLAA